MYACTTSNTTLTTTEEIGFPSWCVRVCRPYDSCKGFGINNNNNYYY